MINAYYSIVISFFNFLGSITGVNFMFSTNGVVWYLTDYIFLTSAFWIFLRLYKYFTTKR